MRHDELLRRMRAEAEDIFRHALTAVDPAEAVQRFVHLAGDTLLLERDHGEPVRFDLQRFRRILVVGVGKATAPMARALEELLGSRIQGGVITVKYGFAEPLSTVEVIEAGHPVPDQRGVEATEKIVACLEAAGDRDLVLALISGGGSALSPLPQTGITLQEKQAITRQLLACGASIDEINAVRKHISRSKGGQLARSAYPATVINLMLSDVVGDRLDVIASGPFAPDESTYADVREIFERYALSEVPRSIERHIQAGLDKKIPETPKPGDPIFANVHHVVVGSNILALQAAQRKATAQGYNALILSSMVEGESREVARVHSAVAKEILSTANPCPLPACVISGGETTVTLQGEGLGGRNQEFCLAAALDLVGCPPRVVILSAGTDGNDGPTDAAGAIVDPLTVRRGTEAGLQPRHFLATNDTYHFLEKTGDLLITGPTRTNVMDVRLILVR